MAQEPVYYASKFTTTDAMSVRSVSIYAKCSSLTQFTTIYVGFLADSAGAPGAVLTTAYNTIDLDATYQQIRIPITYSLSASTTYWFYVGIGSNSGETNSIGYDTSVASNYVYRSYDKSTWTQLYTDSAIYFQISTKSLGNGIFFDYKGGEYFVTVPDDQSAPKLYLNGYRGAATSNSSDKTKTNTLLNLSGVNLAGKVIKITAGPGSKETVPYRTIVSNTSTGTNDSITVSPAWCTEQTTATEYVILGCDTWQEVSLTAGHLLTRPVTDVLVVNDLVYFAQGEDTNIVCFEAYNNSGTWTNRSDTNGTNKATYLLFIQNEKGQRKIWRALSSACTVSSADVVAAYNTDLAFSTDINCGSTNYRITNIVAYGTPAIPWVLKENEIGSIANDIYAKAPISGYEALASLNNGRAAVVSNVYLYFSLRNGIERYYDQHMDDIGPNRDKGLPTTNRGPIYHMIAYAGGRLYCAIDAGETGYSSILMYNETGYCELYRAAYGNRIRRLHIQTIPGKSVERLWFCEEEDLCWIPIAINPYMESTYTYQTGGYLITPWIYGNYRDVIKYWNAVKVETENCTTNVKILVEYQTDDGSTWTTAAGGTSGYVTDSPIEKILLGSSSVNVTGYRIRFRFTLVTNNTSITPRIIAILVESVTRITPKDSYTIRFIVEDTQPDLNGAYSTDSAETVMTKLDTWADSDTQPSPLTMRCIIPQYDDKRVFIDPASIELLDYIEQRASRPARFICSMTLYEA